MSRNTLLALFGTLVVLIVISQLTGQRRAATTAGGGFVDIVESFDRDEVHRVRAWLGAETDSSVVIERAGNGWVVPSAHGWPAKEATVSALFDNFDKLKGEKRSSSEEVLSDYALDEDGALHVIAESSGGEEAFHLYVGKNVRGSNNFVRHANSMDAYASNVNLRSSFGVWGDDPTSPSQTSWIDLKLLAVQPSDVDKVVVHDGDTTFTLEKVFAMVEPDSAAAAAGATPATDRNSWTWKPDGRGDIAKSKADAVVRRFQNLSAADVADPSAVDTYGLGDGGRHVVVTMMDGVEHVVRFGGVTPEDENRVYVMLEGGRPAQMWKGTSDQIFVERASLSPDEG